jgi:uncharacterized membrane protein
MMERVLSGFLRIGVKFCAMVLSIGAVLALLAGHPSFSPALIHTLTSGVILEESPREPVVSAGIALLFLLPVGALVISSAFFWVKRERSNAAFAAVVLLTIALSFFLSF